MDGAEALAAVLAVSGSGIGGRKMVIWTPGRVPSAVRPERKPLWSHATQEGTLRRLDVGGRNGFYFSVVRCAAHQTFTGALELPGSGTTTKTAQFNQRRLCTNPGGAPRVVNSFIFFLKKKRASEVPWTPEAEQPCCQDESELLVDME